jgi:hypothetical protein
MNKTGNPERICAIDASTNSLAFAVYENKNLKEFGKINFEGSDIYQKVGDAAVKTRAYFKDFMKADAIVIEHTVFMNSPKTAADLALVQGALLGAAAMCGITTVGKVSPITWQNYLGNKRLTKEEQLLLRSKNPGKSDSWYKTYERQFRKERTIKLIEINYDKTINDNDVADACGIGHWAINNWDKAVGVDK